MSDRIEQAAEIIADMAEATLSDGYVDAPDIVHTLSAAGLLAPTMREEWGIRWDDGTLWGHYLNQAEAQAGAGDGTDPTDGTVMHRYVTDWEEA